MKGHFKRSLQEEKLRTLENFIDLCVQLELERTGSGFASLESAFEKGLIPEATYQGVYRLLEDPTVPYEITFKT